MKVILESIAKQLINHSESLDNSSTLIDNPWVLIDEVFEVQKLVFKKDRTVILSSKGNVRTGKWEYSPEAKSLLIESKSETILCRDVFINHGVMIMQLVSIDNRLFILANENAIPDLDAIGYLKKLRLKKLNLTEIKLADGRIIEVLRNDLFLNPTIGNLVTFKNDPIEDGTFKLAETNRSYEIKKGKIVKILKEMKYVNPVGLEIHVQQQESRKIIKDDYVFLSGVKVDKAIINFSPTKNLVVRHGQVVRLERNNMWALFLSKMGF